MNKQAVYSESSTKRAISIPGGEMWLAQRFVGGPRGGKGQNKGRINGESVPHIDPWENIGQPTDRASAIVRIQEIKVR